MRRVPGPCAGILLVLSVPLTLAGALLEVVDVEPAPAARGASADSSIVIHFDRPVVRSSITAGARLKAFAKGSGAVTGAYVFEDGDRTVTLIPDGPFAAGESVMVILASGVEGTDGSALRSAGFSYQFWTAARPAVLNFVEVDRKTTRTVATVSSRAYGGIASDVNGDGFLDVTIVNEDSADLRVFLNRADGNGTFLRFLSPTFAVGNRASPSEPADFDGDGAVDICVANINDNTISILLGAGDGSFGVQQVIPVGSAPRGIAVLDVDGDGDVDVVNTNSGSPGPNLTLMLNDGNGVFSSATFFDSGVSNAWALAAVDMDRDGILDLVVGARQPETIAVLLGDGNRAFHLLGTQDAGGKVWMLVAGDVNADGADDISTIHDTPSTGSILLNTGDGNLGPPDVYPADPFGLATDLGDANGDGHLDWVTSSLNGNWRLNLNNGEGEFAFNQAFVPTQASSCALMLDTDNDGDLDLALIDELADEVIFMRNSGRALPPTLTAVPDGTVGTPLSVDKLDAGGSKLSVRWDTATCPDAVDYQIVYGDGSGLPASPGGVYALSGSRCAIGSAPPFPWLGTPDPSADPRGLLWFLVLATDGDVAEGGWGVDWAGIERTGPGVGGVSGQCDMSLKEISGSCVD